MLLPLFQSSAEPTFIALTLPMLDKVFRPKERVCDECDKIAVKKFTTKLYSRDLV